MERSRIRNDLEMEHRDWLVSFDQQYLRNWEKLLAADEEAARTEACVRRILQEEGVSVEPNEDLTGVESRSDFKCSIDDQDFYVEVTHISVAKVVEVTGLPHPTEPGARHYGLLNDAFWAACKGKAAQCGNHDAPVLVAIGTFHTAASVLCTSRPHVEMLLTGETQISFDFDGRRGTAVGEPYETTALRSATFLRPDKATAIGFARGSISGLLICGLGVEPPDIRGVLHPNPARVFLPGWLPRIDFGEIEIDHEGGYFHVRWPKGNDDKWTTPKSKTP